MAQSTISHQGKQRGVYSEMINLESSALLTKQETLAGPDSTILIETQHRQKVPRAHRLNYSFDGYKAPSRRPHHEDEITVDPKVMEPFDPVPNQVPRKVAIDRKRKEYTSFDIDVLLRTNGIDFNHSNQKVEWLKLEYFDDANYDDFLPDDWIRRKVDEEGIHRRLVGKGLFKNQAGRFVWRRLEVLNYDHTYDQFLIVWRDTGEHAKLKRIYFCLDAEDPRKYVDRLLNAFKQRIYADAIIRYNFTIDNMPIINADLPDLDQEQRKRLEMLARAPKRLKEVDVSSIMADVGYDFNRTMNKIIFDDQLASGTIENLPRLELPPLAGKEETRETGMMPLERLKEGAKDLIITGRDLAYQNPKPFGQTFTSFCFHSMLIKNEVIKALQEIMVRCNQVVNYNLFDLDLTKTHLILEEFKHRQESSISQMLYSLKGNWIEQLVKIIRHNFSAVGKGWFNMQETSKITYDFGKLKRFLTVVRLMMQDSILALIKRNYQDLRAFILDFLPKKIQVFSPSSVRNQFIEDQTYLQKLSPEEQEQQKKKRNRQPLFVLELIKANKENRFTFSTQPQSFVSMIVHLFQKPLEDIAKIPDLEPKILSDLHKSAKNDAFIKAPMKPRDKPIDPDPTSIPRKLPDENKWIWDLIEDMKANVQRGIAPLAEYEKVWSPYIEVLKMDPDEYVRQIEMADTPWEVDQYQNEITKICQENETMRNNLPSKIQVSFFEISCLQMKEFLSDKYKTLQKNLIGMIAKKARGQSQSLFNAYQMIQNKIKESPNDIEKLTQIQEYIANLPNQLDKLRIEMERCFDIYTILQSFNYRFSKDQLQRRWNIFGSPKQIFSLVEKRQRELQKKKADFLETMKQDQSEFKGQIDNLQMTIRDFHNNQNIKQSARYSQQAKEMFKSLDEVNKKAKLFASRENLFNIESTDYSKIQQMVKQFTPFGNLWITANDWSIKNKNWLKDPWEELDANSAERFVDDSSRLLAGIIRFFKEREINSIMKIAQTVRNEIEQFKPKIPLMVALRKKGMVERHWQQISSKVGFKVQPDQTFTFQKVLDLGLLNYTDICVEIGQRAAKEYAIETSLDSMQTTWMTINFILLQYKGTFIIKNYDDIQVVLDQHIISTQTMQFSPFKEPFKDRLLNWNNTLKVMSDILEQWAKCQRQWMYLQPIFDSPDISKQLPNQSKKFKTVNSTWTHTMEHSSKVRKVLDICSQEGLLERLQQANKNLEAIQKQLNNYLEKKREKFARFYFLSNSDLLEILSQTKEPIAVQPHLKKVFENINLVEFDTGKRIHAMFSAQNERVAFPKLVDPNKKNVEEWMGELEEMMRFSVKEALQNSVKDYTKRKRADWAIMHAGQTVLNGSQIHWTNEVEASFKSNTVKDYWEVLNQYLADLVELVRQKLEKQALVTINALIVIDVHAKDVVEKLWRGNVHDASAFEWISQLRYYWENDNCFVKCIQTNFPYGYEYLGNTLRLVITPLTDKCYMTLMGALKLNLGGAPAGPAGTGKTESVKDLAKALAKQCVVFNCSDSMDYLMIGKFFKGLASAGAWCCFDEFNRINIEVLSVIAQQLLILFGEKAKGTPQIEFEDSIIKIMPTFSVFITMNPGYAGRTELPDNLKALFRPMAMMVPDYAMIGEIMLYSFGFTLGRSLARKMVATFKLASEQLSSQDHYDYGMRAVRSVINAAGLLKAASPDMNEEQLLLRALRDVNVPKFLKDDLPLFENIIKDLFPGIEKPVIEYGNLLGSIEGACATQNLQPIQPFVDKVIQLYDTIQVRHGLMIVGPTGGAKTTNYKTLQRAMTQLKDEPSFAKVHTHILNPKSIKIPAQLYGDYNEQTHEWADGILAYTVRECVKDESPDKHWIMFDGPVDALWIESMNTVLDDNKKLCLNSGQILTLTPRMTMMFEVEDLAVASPATVSRCGMVYMEPQALGIQMLFDTWAQLLPENIRGHKKIVPRFKELIKELAPEIIAFMRGKCKEIVASMDNNIAASLLKIINCFLVHYTETEIKKVTFEDLDLLYGMVDKIFIFAATWSLCATVDLDGRQTMNEYIRRIIGEKGIRPDLPDSLSIYGFCLDAKARDWITWTEYNGEMSIDSKKLFHEITIPTEDSGRNLFLMKTLIANSRHVLSPGPTGTGKSQNISTMLVNLSDEYQYLSITFSAQSGCNQTQDTIDSKLDKRRKGVYGPPIGKKFVIFIDDLNMPKKEQYGAQPPIELVRQYLDHNGWYNRKELQFMQIQDLIILSAMGPPGGGRTFITNRIIRHFNMIAYTELDKAVIEQIFNTLVMNFYKRYNEAVRTVMPQVIQSVLDIFKTVKATLLPTPSKSHYTFNMRDIWRVFQGICSSTPKYVSEPKTLARLWYHENLRVFHDRLTTEDDRLELKAMLKARMSFFESDIEEILSPEIERVIFGDFTGGRDSENKVYAQIEDLSSLVLKMDSFQEDFNTDINFIIGGPKKQMKLVMFLDACEHIARIARIIRQPQGNSLILGVGGSGRQSLSRMATYLTGYKLFQIEMSKNYNMRSWRDDLKKVLMMAGIENKPISFLFCDTQIINEQMLEDINSILNSGDVTGIYQDKDEEEIILACKNDCVKAGITPTKINIFTQYLQRVKRNIHMIICMSPLGDLFATRLRMFPSLINSSTIDWFTQWPEEALINVGKGQLIEYEQDLGIEGKIPALVEVFKTIHKSVEKISVRFLQELRRHNYVTPTSYLELLNMYRQILVEKKNELRRQSDRLKSGLDKLDSANTEVNKMEKELKVMQPELEKKNVEVGKLMESISIDKEEANKTQKLVAAESEIATQEEKNALEIAEEQEQRCAEANRNLAECLAKVDQLKRDHLTEIKTFTSPTEPVKVVAAGLVILLWPMILKNGGSMIYIQQPGAITKEENYFETMKKYLMGNVLELKEYIKDFNKDEISDKMANKLHEKCISNSNFNFQAVAKSSYAASYLQLWVSAMFSYNKIYKETEPQRKKLEEIKAVVAEKKEILRVKNEELQKINDRIDTLERQYNESLAEKEELNKKIHECEVKLQRAQKLTEGLSEEKTRWGQEIKNLEFKIQLVPGDSVIASGMISYSGPFTSIFREELEKGWVLALAQVKLMHSDGISMRSYLGDPVKIQSWNISELPKDDTSTENGIIIDKTRRWPLMIDPQSQANKFIKNLSQEHTEGIDVIKNNDANLMRVVELAVQFGRWVLLENVQRELDPALEPILSQQITKTSSSSDGGVIQIGDKQLSYNASFKFFMTTTLPNPHFSPETFVKVSIINFAITPRGLEEQMLAMIVSLENPNLEQKKTEIVKKNAADKKELLKIEDSILQELNEKQGGIDEILKDESMIIKLQSSKKFAAEINQRVKDSKITEIEIDKARESYRSVAFRSSLLYFCILDLSLIDPMYQYSLQWFSNLFVLGVENSAPSNVLEERLENMKEYFTYSLYENICRSLFQKHKLLFSFMLTVKILFGDGLMNEKEWRFFLAGTSGDIAIPSNPTTWINENVWPEVYRQIKGMSDIYGSYKGLDTFFLKHCDAFKPFYDSQAPQEEKLPAPYDRIPSFDRLAFLKALRSDKLVEGVQNWIVERMDKKYIIVPTFNLANCFKDSTITTPLIFVLSAGSDPIGDFMKFAEECGMGKRVDSISLGQGQGPKAERLVRDSTQRGGWTILQNCHLAVSWMKELEKLVEELNENMHKDFRLWLTSMPSVSFPISVLQNGVKMTIEPPQGLRANLLRTYNNISEAELNDCKKPEVFKKLLFGFCLFHAIIQDRRKFGPIGWNIQYEFTNEDLRVCKRQLKMLLDEYDVIPYKVINFLGAEINYGGRVTDDKDVRLIKTILKNYINEQSLKDHYSYSSSGKYYSPPVGALQSYIDYISSFPLSPAAEAFGLHSNAEITNSQNEGAALLETILSVQPRVSSGSGLAREEIIEGIVTFVEERTPREWDIEAIFKQYPTLYEESMNTVLIQELIRYNRLIAVMIDSLKNARKALKGQIVMSEELEGMTNSLFDNQVPALWADKGFLSLKLLNSWVQDLTDRINFLNGWIEKGTPDVFWVSGFFFPQAFMTGALQNFARKHVIAIDTIGFEFKMMGAVTHTDIKEKPEDGVYIYGMYIEGAKWDSKKHILGWPYPKELYSDMPMIHLNPVADRERPADGLYDCPLYKVVSRRGTLSTTGHSTNFVMYIELPTRENEDTWIKAGAAMFLSLKY